MKIEQSKLSEDELREYAILATEIRRNFKSSVEAVKTKIEERSAYGDVDTLEEAPQLARQYLSKPKQTI